MDSFDDKLRKQGEEIHKKAYDNQEKIEEALKVIDDFEKSKPMKMFDLESSHKIISKIKEILEK